MANIIIVDDEAQTRGSIRRILEDDGHTIREAGNGDEALALLKTVQPDLMVLDIIMPGMSGIDLCRRLRADPFYARIPIIFLTAKSRPKDIAAGLDAGGDDYITKPVEVIELPARVRACLRRGLDGTLNSQSDILVVGTLRLHLTNFELTKGNEIIELSGTEHRLLHALMVRAGQPVSIDQLLQDVWEYPPGVGDPAIVYAHIKNLRQKIEPDATMTPQHLRNIRGRGYLISG
jgi:DNA-binding response OmpR family regulator